MSKNKQLDSYYSKVTCRLYILGTAAEGECIVLALYGDDRIIYSCVTDSFVFNNQPAASYVLRDANVSRISDLFWTHPHDDHSAGLIDLINCYNPQNVFIPAELLNLPDNMTSVSRNVLDELNQYHSLDKRYSYQPNVRPISANYIVQSEKIKCGMQTIPFEIFAIAPCSGRVRRNSITHNYSNLNEYSLAIEIMIGDFAVLLTGDIQNRTLAYLSEELCKKPYIPNILKIPHHGSKDSTGIISLFDTDAGVFQSDIAVTTAKRTSKLPQKDAMNFYSAYSNYLYEIDDDSNGLAIWGVEVDILQAEMTQIFDSNFCYG